MSYWMSLLGLSGHHLLHRPVLTQSGHHYFQRYHLFRYDAVRGVEMALPNTRTSMVAVGDTQLQCYETGTGDPVLLVSGWPQSALCWEKVIPLLASDYRLIAVEPPALGFSHPTS